MIFSQQIEMARFTIVVHSHRDPKFFLTKKEIRDENPTRARSGGVLSSAC